MNRATVINNLKNGVLVGATGIGFVCVSVGLGLGNKGFNLYVFGAGIIILFPFILYYIIKHFAHKNKRAKQLVALENFKGSAETISVDLSQVEIKSINQKLRQPTWHIDYRGIGALIDPEDQRFRDKNKTTNLVEFLLPINGKTLPILFEIEMDLATLKLHLQLQKETTYYYEANHPENGFLDLNFLGNS